MNESNLARSLFSEPKGQVARKKNLQPATSSSSIKVHPVPANSQEEKLVGSNPLSLVDTSLEAEVNELKQELAELKKSFAQRETDYQEKCMYVELLTTENSYLKESQAESSQLQEQINLVTTELSKSETTIQTLQHSLSEQLQLNWEQKYNQQAATLEEVQRQSQSDLSAKLAEIEHLQQINAQLLQDQQELISSLNKHKADLAESHKIIQALQKQQSPYNGQNNEDLESQIFKHLSSQVILQQSLQELEINYAAAQSRLTELEPQIAELQEQILKQVGQAAEYEAAIQHWKYQSMTHQRHAIQLSGALDRLLEDKEAKKAEVISRNDVEVPTNHGYNTPPTSTKSPTIVDLPAFLLRQR